MIKVFLTYDFLTTALERGVTRHLQKCDFLFDIFTASQIELVQDRGALTREDLFKIMHKADTTRVFCDVGYDQINTKVKERVFHYLKEYDYVLGYELSETTRKLFDELGIVYIDMWLSPIRFYKDIMFEFYSNDSRVQAFFKSNALDENSLYKESASLQQHVKHFVPLKEKLADNSLLLITQLENDKSVMKGQRFLGLIDFLDEVEHLAKKFNRVYLIKHPLMSSNEFLQIMQSFAHIGNLTVLENVNTYVLLSQKEVRAVAGISSSVLTEAKYFGKAVHFFYKPVLSKKYSRIYREIFQTGFWQQVFAIPTTLNKTFFAPDNYLRCRYAGLMYAYDIFVQKESIEQKVQKQSYVVITQIFGFIQALDKEKKYILYGYGSVGKLIYPHIKKNLVGIIDKSFGEKDTVDGTKVLKEQQLNGYKDATILVTPYIHKEVIKQSLKHCENEVIFLQ